MLSLDSRKFLKFSAFIFLIFLTSLFILLSPVFATTSLTSAESVEFVKSCCDFLNINYVDIPSPSYSCYSMIFFYDTSSQRYSIIYIVNGVAYSNIDYSSGSYDFNFYGQSGGPHIVSRFNLLSNGKWSKELEPVSFSPERNDTLFIIDTLPITSNISLKYYSYSLGTKDFTQQITNITNELNSLNSRVTSVENDVNDINSGIGGISGQLDTVISNQDKLYQDTNKTADDFSSAFPTVEIEDVTQASFESIANGISTAFTSTTPVTVSFSFRGNQYNISSDQIGVKNSTLLNFLTIVCTFGISYWLILDLRREIQKIQEGKIEKIANEDISANML